MMTALNGWLAFIPFGKRFERGGGNEHLLPLVPDHLGVARIVGAKPGAFLELAFTGNHDREKSRKRGLRLQLGGMPLLKLGE